MMIETIEIRKVKPSDLAGVVMTEAQCFPAAEAADEKSLKARIEAFPESFLVAEQEGRIIGFINGAVTDRETIIDEMFEDSTLHNPKGKYQSIFGLDVIEEYRHQGLASRLMEEMIATAKRQGRQGLILTCKEHLIGFYERFGYINKGVSQSVHGGAVWYDMMLTIQPCED